MIENNTLPDSFDGLKIVHFSDLLFGSTVDMEDVSERLATMLLCNYLISNTLCFDGVPTLPLKMPSSNTCSW